MRTLYLDNYKGFINTFIPFKDVNFLVGENSTGKTTVLNLIYVITQSDFNFAYKFNTDDVVLGYFSEIVSQYSKDKSYFSIGLEWSPIKKSGKKIVEFLLMKFVNDNNIPVLSEYMTIVKNKTILVCFPDGNPIYFSKDQEGKNFNEWIKSYDDLKKTTGTRFALPTSTLEIKEIPTNILRHQIISMLLTQEGDENMSNKLFRSFMRHVTFFSPIRAKAKRVYEGFVTTFSPEGAHTPVYLRNVFSNNRKEKIKKESSLMKFGKDSSLYDSIAVREFGKSAEGPFEVDIKYGKHRTKITDVGFGVSQVLPIVADIYSSANRTFSIQQPEVHLHPKAQAAFGELVFSSAVKDNNRFIIETHSNYTIDRFRYHMHLSVSKKKIDAQVLFFERTPNGMQVTPLEFKGNGQYPDDMPRAYSEFFIDEELKKLEI